MATTTNLLGFFKRTVTATKRKLQSQITATGFFKKTEVQDISDDTVICLGDKKRFVFCLFIQVIH